MKPCLCLITIESFISLCFLSNTHGVAYYYIKKEEIMYPFQATIKNICVHMVLRPHKIEHYEMIWIRQSKSILNLIILGHHLGTQQFFQFCLCHGRVHGHFPFLDLKPVKYGLAIWGMPPLKVGLGHAVPCLTCGSWPMCHWYIGRHVLRFNLCEISTNWMLNSWLLMSFKCTMIVS